MGRRGSCVRRGGRVCVLVCWSRVGVVQPGSGGQMEMEMGGDVVLMGMRGSVECGGRFGLLLGRFGER